MWDLPGPGIEPMCPRVADRCLTPGPPEKPHNIFNIETVFLVEMGLRNGRKAGRRLKSGPVWKSWPETLETQSCKDRSSEFVSVLGAWHSVSTEIIKNSKEDSDPFVHLPFMLFMFPITQRSWKGREGSKSWVCLGGCWRNHHQCLALGGSRVWGVY